MLVAERWQRIVQLVNERGSIRVSDLSDLCHVTEETIRRDLDKLEHEGKLTRSHGGAISVKDSQKETDYFERETTNSDEKMVIAYEAVQRIQPGDRIVLDASSTAWYMAKLLPDNFPLTVLTNSIKVALELSGKEKLEIISTGGVLSPRSLSFVGPLAERSLASYHVNKSFISCKGVHLERGISEVNEAQALVKQKMIAISDEVYLLSDYSKFGVQAFSKVAGWERIYEVITDTKAPAEFLNQLTERGVKYCSCTN